MRKPVLLTLTVVLLAACSHRPASPLDMWYKIEGGEQLGIVRAMSDSDHTIIQFRTTDPITATVTDDTGWTVPWSRVGPYMVLSGIQPMVRVRIGEAEATIRLARMP